MALSGKEVTSGSVASHTVFVSKDDGPAICMCVWATEESAEVRVDNLHATGDWLELDPNNPVYFTVDTGIQNLWFRMTSLTDTPIFYWGVVRGGM